MPSRPIVPPAPAKSIGRLVECGGLLVLPEGSVPKISLEEAERQPWKPHGRATFSMIADPPQPIASL